ncbi:MAG: hypothetical protein M5U34_40260 [Chloroflexi bacterium]|nr:hypothetical protein [Chloroflexota bacterium]
MNELLTTSSTNLPTPARFVAAGEDCFGEHRGLGISVIEFKLAPQDGSGLFILENVFTGKAARPGICIMSKMSGFTRWKGSLSWR